MPTKLIAVDVPDRHADCDAWELLEYAVEAYLFRPRFIDLDADTLERAADARLMEQVSHYHETQADRDANQLRTAAAALRGSEESELAQRAIDMMRQLNEDMQALPDPRGLRGSDGSDA